MPDELNPCPNPLCGTTKALRTYYRTGGYTRIACNCGVSGPYAQDESEAGRRWNVLPRQPQWTEYDGSENTLPLEGTYVLIESGRSRDRFSFLYRKRHTIFEIGDRWMPWPLPGGGE